MMASDILYIVFVALCAMHSVHSYSITGTIEAEIGEIHEVNVSNYVHGEHWGIIQTLTLDRLEGASTVSTLTVANFGSIGTLKLENIGLEHVPVFLNTAIDKVFITGNKIKRVPSYAFSGAGPTLIALSNNEIRNMAAKSIPRFVAHVHLDCNRISRFTQSWFVSPEHTEILNLGGNRIEHIEDRAFTVMTRLYLLYLNNNRITSIGSDAFGSAINSLTLQFNSITRLTPEMFADRKGRDVVELFLHHNQLNYLPEALLRKLKPRSISYFGNPWLCQCLRDLQRWLRELKSTRLIAGHRHTEPVCVAPVNLQTACVQTVDKELQETYARGLSPVEGCWATGCQCGNESVLSALSRLS